VVDLRRNVHPLKGSSLDHFRGDAHTASGNPRPF
jgi:hypothetical protein